MRNYWSRKQLEALGEPINPQAPTRLSRVVGGGGKGTKVEAPDYVGAAEKQAQASKEATNAQTIANRPNIITPWGTQSWTNNKTFDQAGYDAAMAQYNAQPKATAPTSRWVEGNSSSGGESDGFGNSGGYWEQVAGTPGGTMAMPDRNAFMTDNWVQSTSLNPEVQAALDSQMKIQRARSDLASTMMPSVQEAITKPIDYNSMTEFGKVPTQSLFQFMGATPKLQDTLNTSDNPAMPTYDRGFVQDVQNQALDYMRPDQVMQQTALESKLRNMGLTPGSTAYENAFRQLNDQQSRDKYLALNTAMNQAQGMYNGQLAANNQAFNQDLASGGFTNSARTGQQAMDQSAAQFNNTTMNNQFSQQMATANYQNVLRQQQIAEAQMRQLQPLNNMNALLTGQQVSMPQMPSFAQAGAYQPTQYVNAANGQYQADVANANAQNAASNNFMSGLFSLGGMALGGPMGGMLGGMMGKTFAGGGAP